MVEGRRSVVNINPPAPVRTGTMPGHSIPLGQVFWGKWTRDNVDYGNPRELWIKGHTCVTQLSGAAGTTVSNQADFEEYQPVDVDIIVTPWRETDQK